MENSSCGEHCSFVKSGFCDTEKDCPFYVETWWKKGQEETPKLVKDCFPKKFALEQNHLLHRFICVQGALEEMRNRFASLESILMNLVVQSKEALKQEELRISKEKKDPKLLEEKEK